MKTIATFIAALFILNTLCNAQDGIMAVRAGGGLVVEDPQGGLAVAFDLKTAKVPIAFAPYFQFFTSSGYNKLYLGAEVQFAKNLLKGLNFGLGGGIAKWKLHGISRTSPSIGPLLGYRIRLSNNLGLFVQGKFFINTKTKQDTDDFNSGQLINGPLFDNDITAIAGLSYLLK
jgi:hypothetical protein